MVVTTGRRGEREALHGVLARGMKHVGGDEDVVAADAGEIRSNVDDAAHVGSEVIDFVDAAACGKQALIKFAAILNLEFVGWTGFVLRSLNIDTADPVTIGFQTADQMMPNKATCTRN